MRNVPTTDDIRSAIQSTSPNASKGLLRWASCKIDVLLDRVNHLESENIELRCQLDERRVAVRMRDDQLNEEIARNAEESISIGQWLANYEALKREEA